MSADARANYKIIQLRNYKMKREANLRLPLTDNWLLTTGYCFYAALFAPLTSSVLPELTPILICFGLASAFFANWIFSTPLS